jgi:hypothetical protein
MEFSTDGNDKERKDACIHEDVLGKEGLRVVGIS